MINQTVVYKKVFYDSYRDVFVYKNWNIEAPFANKLANKEKQNITKKGLEKFIIGLYKEYSDYGTIGYLLREMSTT